MSRIEDIKKQIDALQYCDRLHTDPYKKAELDDLERELRDLQSKLSFCALALSPPRADVLSMTVKGSLINTNQTKETKIMDNQHNLIKGYRDLTKDEIDLMNEAKDLAEKVGRFIEGVSVVHAETGSHAIDMRWLNIAKTDLQKGFMALIRSIAQPTTF